MIDLLQSDFFQGIPGLDLSLRKTSYTRENSIPTFIYERVPQENREDLWDLLNEVDLDYYNPLEWLIRTHRVYTGDSLNVSAYVEPQEKKIIDNIQPYDVFEINEIKDVSRVNLKRIQLLLEIIIKGAYLKAKDFEITDKNRKNLHTLLLHQFISEIKNQKRKQSKGIKENAHKYTGRKRIKISYPKLVEVLTKYNNKSIDLKTAMNDLNLKSKSTFYRRLNEFNDKN